MRSFKTALIAATTVGFVALGIAPPAAEAKPTPVCAEGFEVVCYVLALTCIKQNPCHP